MNFITIDLPEYTIESPPDHKAIGKKVDDVLREHYMGQAIIVRGVASSEHPEKTKDELIRIIKQTGTDRYDAERTGDRYENVEGKHIDFFGVPAIISPTSSVFETIVYGFYHSAIGIHGKPQRIDIVTIYDAEKVEQVVHRYEGCDDIKNDGFAFKEPTQKPDSILGIIKLT